MECNPCQGEGCNMEECKGDSCCFGDSEPLPFYQTPLAAVTRRRTAATPTPTSAMPSVAAFGDCSLLAHHSLLLSPHCSLSLGSLYSRSLFAHFPLLSLWSLLFMISLEFPFSCSLSLSCTPPSPAMQIPSSPSSRFTEACQAATEGTAWSLLPCPTFCSSLFLSASLLSASLTLLELSSLFTAGGGRRKSLRPAQALQGCQEFGQKTKLT
mmetsp:Transcript_33473/g.78991  ORF Transcript_33473/g.78991 Transcript_33473/m.78991 type:complete len:211 (-) Transcript_33473:548-1180(-)